jgi:hypothetical protein
MHAGRWATNMRSSVDLAVLIQAQYAQATPSHAAPPAPLFAQRIGPEAVGPGAVAQEGHFDATPGAEHEGNGSEQGSDQGSKPIPQIQARPGRDKQRHNPPAAPVAIVPALDRGRKKNPR